MTTDEWTVDVAMWVGAYPFRHLARHDAAALQLAMKANCIRHAVVSHFDFLFQEDNLAAYLNTVTGLEERDDCEVWPVVNPSRPAQIERLQWALERKPARGIRLLPNYHHYNLADPCVTDLMAWAGERGLIVQVFQQIADVRWQWMLCVPPVPLREIQEFTGTVQQGSRLILSGLDRPEAVAAAIAPQPEVYVDLSRLRGPQFAVEAVARGVPVSRLLFGSLWPLQLIEATLWQVQLAGIPHTERQRILYGNARRILGLAG